MAKKRILVVFGTRPEAIKLAPVIHELKAGTSIFETIVCVTAQHRNMLDQVLSLFEIRPDYDLNIMAPGQSLAQISVRAMRELDLTIDRVKPDVVLVQGDTTTTFCGALTAFYHKVAVAHVEAGLRTMNKYAPFPEEINRRLVSHIADYDFAPTKLAREFLLKEGIEGNRIYVTGNTVVDSLLRIRERVRNKTPDLPGGLIDSMGMREVILITGHRRESFGAGFENMCQAVRQVADNYEDIMFVYPVHLNPNVQEPVNRILGGHERIRLVEPLSYDAFIWLMDRATIVMTDSGGVQEEAPSLGKPVLVMRETTERPEGIEAGNACLVGVDRESIIKGIVNLIENPEKRNQMGKVSNPYGDGKASKRIVDILANT